jgi:L-glutamine-phosphate cytidylyltransferase
MRAIILAAGRGSRMGGATADQPKCLTPLHGRTLLDWQLEALRSAGIESIALVRGYMGEKLARNGLRTFDNPRWAETNMVMSLACASAWLTSDVCLVSYSDIAYPAATARRLAAASGDIAITYYKDWRRLWEARFKDPLSDAESFRLDDSGRLLDIGARPRSLDEVQGQYMGLLRFTPGGWQSVEGILGGLDAAQRDKLDMTSLLRLLLARGQAITAVPVEEPWYEVDSQSDLELYQAMALRRGGLF